LSRSIHATLRQLRKIRRADYADPVRQQVQISRVVEQLAEKHIIKAQVWQQRHQVQMDTTPTPVADLLPINIYDESALIHYPASADDLRAVMRLLPPGTLDGVSKIICRLGKEAQQKERHDRSAAGEPDPLVGRLGVELLPGVFVGRCLGSYSRQSAAILLYAYVYDAAILPDRQMREWYLRYQMLSTFVHEVAHHKGKLTEGKRGRWLVRPGEASESYAREYEYRWVRQIVVPYLEQAYPDDARALVDWMIVHGGVALPFVSFADSCKDPFFHGSAAFESLVAAVDEQQSLRETRLDFASSLYYAHYYPEALHCLSLIIAEHPDDAEALVLQARVYENQERYDEAERLAKHVLELEAVSEDAWRVLEWVYEARGDWPNLEVAATQRMELGDKQDAIYARHSRVKARIELGDFQGASADMEVLAAQVFLKPDVKIRWLEKSLVVLRALLCLRMGQYEEALALATASLKTKRRSGKRWRSGWRKEFLAVRFEAAHQLGRPAEAGILTADDIARLR